MSRNTFPLGATWLRTRQPHPAPSHLPTSCLSCCSHRTAPGNEGFPAGQKGHKPPREMSGRSGVTAEGDVCKQKGFGSSPEDTGQLPLNHHPKGAQFQPGDSCLHAMFPPRHACPLHTWRYREHAVGGDLPKITQYAERASCFSDQQREFLRPFSCPALPEPAVPPAPPRALVHHLRPPPLRRWVPRLREDQTGFQSTRLSARDASGGCFSVPGAQGQVGVGNAAAACVRSPAVRAGRGCAASGAQWAEWLRPP